jgi:hypothetical protein
MILILDQKDDDALVETVFLGGHRMLWMGEHARLEDGSEILSCHAILVGLRSEHGK